MRRWFWVAVAALMVAGCGSPSKAVVTGCSPPPGQGVMGGCAPKTGASNPVLPAGAVRREIADTSYFQGHVNWTAGKRDGLVGGIPRVQDSSFPDPRFADSWRQLRALHMWHAAYAFLRPSGCAGQARLAVQRVNAAGGFDAGSGGLIADAEVPLPYSCATDFLAAFQQVTGWRAPVVIYTAQGTWPGGAHDHALLWDAAYGSRPGCVWTCSVVAWQHTDGQIGAYPHCLPGFGCSDLSVDYGITRVVRSPAHRRPHHSRTAEQRHLQRLLAERDRVRRHLINSGCRVKHPRRACRPLFAHGHLVNVEIAYLHHHFHI